MRIAVSGYSGCGNTSVSRKLAEVLNLEFINYTFRDMADEKGMKFDELRLLAENDDNFDIELDKHQVELAQKSSGCVLASRLAIWMLKEADFKVFLDISFSERVRRISKREGNGLDVAYWEKHTKIRDKNDHERYKRIYDIDNSEFKMVADLVISDDSLGIDETVETIIKKIGRAV